MLQAMVAEPGTHRYVVDHLTANGVADEARLVQVLVEHVGENARVGHMNEVAWALWAIMSLELEVGRELAGVIEHLENDVVALIALMAQKKGLLDGLDATRWRAFVTAGSLYGPHWLLTYEGLASGLLATSDGSDPLAADAFFSKMRRQGVSFLPPSHEDDGDDAANEEDDDGLFEPAAAWEDAYSG